MSVACRRLAALLVLVCPALAAADAPDAPSFAEVGLYAIRDGERAGPIGRTGNGVLRPDPERPFPLSDAPAVFATSRSAGFIDKARQVVVPATYSYARPYEKSLVFMLDKGKSLHIDAADNAVWSGP